MTIINGILLSGWFQLIILSIIFFVYSSRLLKRNLIRGYGLGWMLGLFFIFTYTALNAFQPLQFGAYDSHLNLMQVMGATTFGLFVSVGMSLTAYTFRDNPRWWSIQAAIVTAILVIALFLQVIARPEIRLMVSLFVLAFGMATLAASIMISRRYDAPIAGNPDAPYMGYDETGSQQSVSRLDTIRNQIIQRVNRNNVPTNLPSGPNNQ